MPTERRFLRHDVAPIRLETRDNDQPLIVGYAAVFYREGDPKTEYALWDDVVERIMPGAFDRALKERDDVRGLFNHDPNQLLARLGADTLRLATDSVGLRYEIVPGETSVARDVLAHLRRQDLYGSSFAFSVDSQTWRTAGDLDIREINEVRLYDVGPVTYPAYEGTTSTARSTEEIQEARVAYEAWKHEPALAARLAGYRARSIEISEND